jgi:hypothetical protein
MTTLGPTVHGGTAAEVKVETAAPVSEHTTTATGREGIAAGGGRLELK